MLTEEQRQLAHIQLKTVDEVIRSIIYFRVFRERHGKKDPYTFVGNALIEISVIKWCQVFGTDSEDTHWKKLKVEAPGIQSFSKEAILKATGLKEEEWAKFHEDLLALRNEFFAHFDMDNLNTHIPKLEAALQSAIAYRDWIYSMSKAASGNGYYLNFLGRPTTEFLDIVKKEAANAA